MWIPGRTDASARSRSRCSPGFGLPFCNGRGRRSRPLARGRLEDRFLPIDHRFFVHHVRRVRRVTAFPPLTTRSFCRSPRPPDLTTRNRSCRWSSMVRRAPIRLRVMIWHEIVNDTLAGRAIAVTYCPLCNAAIVFDRTVEGSETTFGTTGKLRNSDLVMYDRETDSWWQQFTGEAITGSRTGVELEVIPRGSRHGKHFARAILMARCSRPTIPAFATMAATPMRDMTPRASRFSIVARCLRASCRFPMSWWCAKAPTGRCLPGPGAARRRDRA
jgi:hypothetical protein